MAFVEYRSQSKKEFSIFGLQKAFAESQQNRPCTSLVSIRTSLPWRIACHNPNTVGMFEFEGLVRS